MKKLLFFFVAMSVSLSINAQIDNRISVPATVQNPSVEKTTEIFLAPNNVGNLPKTNGNKPKHKSNYQYYGIVHNMEYATWDLPVEPNINPPAAGDNTTITSLSNLFPDSLAFHFHYDIGDYTNSGKILTFASAGFVFDPYSFGYDRYQRNGLFRDIAGVGYGYRLDTLWTYVNYRLPLGYNPSSPDTLRFLISYYDVYKNNSGSTNFYSIYYGGDTNRKGIFPIVNYANPVPGKGPYATTPKAPNTVIVDYILTDKDSIVEQPGYYRLRGISIVIPGGYTVPSGSCMGVITQYIPGYNYNLNDTLKVDTWNSQRPNGQQFVNESIQHNYLSIRNWNYDTTYMNYMFDRGGYNGSLHEPMGIRYATDDTTGWGRGLGYTGGYYGKPAFFMSLSISDDDTIHFSDWVDIQGPFHVSATANNSSMGNVTGTGDYAANTTATIIAAAYPGYRFVKWNDSITTNPRTIIVTKDTSFMAIFEAATTYHVTVSANYSIMGSVTGNGDYAVNAVATITATPNTGYRFVEWNDGNLQNPRTIIVTQDTSFMANFEAITHIVSISSNDPSRGIISGSGTYALGSVATIIASPNTGYRFVAWSDNNKESIRAINVTGDIALVALFGREDMYYIYAAPQNSIMGSVVGSNDYHKDNSKPIFKREYAANSIASIEARPNSGYRFVQWNDANRDNPREFTVTGDSIFMAIFESNVGIIDKAVSTVNIYPNPAKDNVHIVLPENIHSAVFMLYDIQGKVLIRKDVSNQETVQVNNLASGIYIYNVRTGTQNYQGKIIVSD